MRIGQGYDLHRLEAGRPLILGGVTIHEPRKPADADVLPPSPTPCLARRILAI